MFFGPNSIMDPGIHTEKYSIGGCYQDFLSDREIAFGGWITTVGAKITGGRLTDEYGKLCNPKGGIGDNIIDISLDYEQVIKIEESKDPLKTLNVQKIKIMFSPKKGKAAIPARYEAIAYIEGERISGKDIEVRGKITKHYLHKL